MLRDIKINYNRVNRVRNAYSLRPHTFFRKQAKLNERIINRLYGYTKRFFPYLFE